MFVNETKNDLDFNLKVAMRIGKKARITIGIAALVILLCGGIVLALELALLAEGESPDLFFAIVCLVLGVLFLAFFFAYKPFMRMLLKKNMRGKEGVVRNAFSEDGYEQTATLNDGTASTTRGDYQSFIECREYSDLWLLYLNKATVFGVSKSGMIEGTAEELTAFFIGKFGPRYKTCFKRK
ncbi:MAG: hypothetical protein K2H43_01740 [Clostridia bacterium]|nr:hypothetical protein [Clostridia bacterium]